MSASLTTATAAARAAQSATAASGGTTTASPGIARDFNTFLTLLTTQLRNQSPTDPLDTNQMTAQLVQFASVEQQISMNQNLTQLVSLQQNSALTSAAGLVGQRVEMQSDQLSLQSGSAELRLPAAGAARVARVTISNSTGTVLREADVQLGTAARSWSWDGRSNTGAQMPDGAYAVAVAAVGADGQTLSTAPAFTIVGTATSAARSGTNVNLNLGALAVPYGQLRSVVN